MPGYSLHIGLNHCDPAAYPGWDSTLGGCINDANSMMQLASAAGFRTKRLIDAEATSNTVLSAIGSLGRTCQAGDIALISYSGHGGQVPDTTGEEADGQDETWVLYDRQVCDDELNQMYAQFQSGVRILVVSDSCHSGTVARSVINLATRHALATSKVGKDMWPAGVVAEEAKPRAMPVLFARKDAQRLEGIYRLVQTLTRGAKNPDLSASLILLAGCQDNQLSYDGNVNGAFTTALLQVWNQGRFSGDYRSFLSGIVSRMPADQTPNFFPQGDVSAFQVQQPFSVAQSNGSGSGGPAAGSTRPVLQQGSRGPDVVFLQQRLTVHGYTLGADGDFGPRTTQAVKSFQLSKGLTADGKVGPLTWQALERSPSDAGSGGDWGSGTSSDASSDTDSDTDWGTGSDTDSDTGWGTDTDTDTDSDSGWGTDSDSDTGSGSDSGAGEWGTDSGSDGGWGTDTDSNSDTDGGWGTDTDSNSNSDTDSGSDGGWGTETDSGSGSDGGWGTDTDTGGTDGGTDTDSGGDEWGTDTDDSWGNGRATRSGPVIMTRPDLRQGETGEHVRFAQQSLRALGYRGPVDGIFSARVEKAIRSLQLSQSLPATGTVDQPTWAVLSSR